MSRTKPTKLTPAKQETITSAIAQGNTRDTAAALAGIAESTLYSWIAKGKKATKGIYFEFYNAIKKAEAFAEADRVKRIQKAGKDGDWKADAWYLERRYPKKWARQDRFTADLNHSGQVVEKHEYEIKHEVQSKLEHDEETQELLEKLFEREQQFRLQESSRSSKV